MRLYFSIHYFSVGLKVVNIILVTEAINSYQKLTSHSQGGWRPGADGALALRLRALSLSVSNWFLINNCNQSWAFTPSSPLTVGANLEGCAYFWAHSPHAARYQETRALTTNHMKGHEGRIVTISKLTQTEPSEEVGWTHSEFFTSHALDVPLKFPLRFHELY